MEWPDQLVSDVARRKCVLFLGAGASASSEGNDGVHPPTWEKFLRICLDQIQGDNSHIQQLLAERDYLTACDLLKDKLGDQWPTELSRAFSEPGFRPTELHKALFALDLRLVLTQNFDKIYDVYAQGETNGSTVVKTYYDTDTPRVMRGRGRAIVKVHGTIDEPSKMVFTRSDYATVRQKNRDFQALMDALFLTHTFLFIGCSLADPDLRLFLEQHAHLHPSAPSHYMTVPEGEIHPDLDGALKRTSNLHLLRYSPGAGHAELVESAWALVSKVESVREEVARTQDW